MYMDNSYSSVYLTSLFVALWVSFVKGPVKLMQWMKIAHWFLQSVSNLFHFISLSLPIKFFIWLSKSFSKPSTKNGEISHLNLKMHKLPQSLVCSRQVSKPSRNPSINSRWQGNQIFLMVSHRSGCSAP